MREHRQGQIVFGRYELERPLAKGGMSQVWVARDRKLQREVAVKLMSTGYATSDRARQRFEREAMLVAKLQSPHVVQIYDYGVDHLSPFIVMELLTGEDLRVRLKRERRLTMAQVGRILVQTAMGLTEAHSAGLVHRDLKPANIHLARSKAGELVKILDFGVAKAQTGGMVVDEDELTQQGSMVGTPQYMSPEQVRCLPEVSARADLWALGIITYRALTGILPFKGRTANDLSVNICSGDFPIATHVNPALPPAVDDFLRVALAKDPADRFDSARAMAETFAQITEESYATLAGISHPGFTSETHPSLPSSPSQITMSGPPPSQSGLSITGAGSAITGQSIPGTLSAPDTLPTVTSLGSASHGGSLIGTMFDETSALRPQRGRRKVVVIVGALTLLATAAVIGSVIGSSQTPSPEGSSNAAAAPSDTAPATAPSEVVDLDETPTAGSAAPAGEHSAAPDDDAPDDDASDDTRPRARRPRPSPAPAPKPTDDYDPFKSRK